MTTAPSPSRPYGNLIAAIATIACCDIAMGLVLQLLPLRMEAAGLPAWLIGVNAAMGPIGILMVGPFLPAVVSRFGSKTVVTTVVSILILCLLSFQLAPAIWLWFPIRFIFGIAAGTMFTVSEAWVLTFADEKNRGRLMGIYTSVLAMTFSVGPLIIPFTGFQGWMPILIGATCVALSILPLAFVQVQDDMFKQEEPGGFFRVVKLAPVLLFAVGATTFFDSVLISFFAIYGHRNGLPISTASTILGLAIIGNVFLFYPLGHLADKWSKRGVVIGTACTTVIACAAMNFLITTWAIWPLMLIVTASSFGVYVVALATVGDVFKGSDVIAGSAAVAAMWGVGGLVGPPIAGAAIDAFGVGALPVTLGAFYVILLLGLARNAGNLVKPSIQT
jgi:MFS family permease